MWRMVIRLLQPIQCRGGSSFSVRGGGGNLTKKKYFTVKGSRFSHAMAYWAMFFVVRQLRVVIQNSLI